MFLKYNSVPTVSYRPNSLGVNTIFNHESTGNEEVILDIHSIQNRKKIRFIGLNNVEMVIDLNSGEISGFNISGGEW